MPGRRRFLATLVGVPAAAVATANLPTLSFTDLKKQRVLGYMDVYVDGTTSTGEPREFLFQKVPAYLDGSIEGKSIKLRLNDVRFEAKENLHVHGLRTVIDLGRNLGGLKKTIRHPTFSATVLAGNTLTLADIRLTIL